MGLIQRIKEHMDPEDVLHVLGLATDQLVDALIEEIQLEAEAFERYLEETS